LENQIQQVDSLAFLLQGVAFGHDRKCVILYKGWHRLKVPNITLPGDVDH